MKGETMIVPSMSAKHSKFIAETLRSLTPERTDDTAPSDWRKFNSDRCEIAEVFADRLAATNSQFNREKFLKACGVE